MAKEYRCETYSDEGSLMDVMNAFSDSGMKPVAIYPAWDEEGTRYVVVWWECEDTNEDEPL